MTNVLGPRDLVSILSGIFGIYKRNFFGVIAIVAILFVPLYTGILYFFFAFQSAVPAFHGSGGFDGETGFFYWMIIFMIYSLISALVYIFISGAITHAVSQQYLRKTMSIRQAYNFTWSRFKTIVGASILFFLALLGMSITIIGIPFAIYFGVRWAFIWQAALLEDVGARSALSRSSIIVKGNWWRVLGIFLLIGLIQAALNGVFGLISSGIFGFISQDGYMVWQTIPSIILTVLIFPIYGICAPLLYFDLRLRKEGLTLNMLAERW